MTAPGLVSAFTTRPTHIRYRSTSVDDFVLHGGGSSNQILTLAAPILQQRLSEAAARLNTQFGRQEISIKFRLD